MFNRAVLGSCCSYSVANVNAAHGQNRLRDGCFPAPHLCTSGVLVGLDDTRIYPVNAGGAKNWQHYANLLSVRASLAKPCPFWTIYITARLGSTGGVFSKVGFGDVLSVLAAHQLGPALSLRSFSRVTPSLGGPPSLLSHTTLASSVSCRPQTRLGDSVSVSGFSSMGSALPLRT